MKRYIDSQMKCIAITLACLLIVVSSLLGNTQPVLAAGPLAVDLGAATSFAILSKTGITDTPTSHITGDVGTSPASGSLIGITCPEVTGTIYSVDAAGPSCKVTNATLLGAAVSAMEAAYTAAAGRTTPAPVVGLGTPPGTIGGLHFAPGIYQWSTGVTIDDDIYLDGTSADDTWIFQIAGTLAVSSGKEVHLTGGAQPKNIFWQVAGTATLGTTSIFNGNILGQTLIALQTLATLHGRALAQSAVTLDHATITASGPAGVSAVAINSPTTAAKIYISTGSTPGQVDVNYTLTDAGGPNSNTVTALLLQGGVTKGSSTSSAVSSPGTHDIYVSTVGLAAGAYDVVVQSQPTGGGSIVNSPTQTGAVVISA
ncbi:MAG: ice-binding family protein, partial [Dehalococcoidia bacterium]